VIAKQEMRHDSYERAQRCSRVTAFNQAESKASNLVFVKYIFSRCDESYTGTAIRLLLGRHMIRNAIGNN